MTEFEISRDLYYLARRWRTYWSHYTDRNGVTRKGMRCKKCHELVLYTKPAVNGVVDHLMRNHGYRMDGRQFDNRNRYIGEAKNACREKGPVKKL